MNGDGVTDLAIGAIHNATVCVDGAMYRVFMDRDGTPLGAGGSSESSAGWGRPTAGSR